MFVLNKEILTEVWLETVTSGLSNQCSTKLGYPALYSWQSLEGASPEAMKPKHMWPGNIITSQVTMLNLGIAVDMRSLTQAGGFYISNFVLLLLGRKLCYVCAWEQNLKGRYNSGNSSVSYLIIAVWLYFLVMGWLQNQCIDVLFFFFRNLFFLPTRLNFS